MWRWGLGSRSTRGLQLALERALTRQAELRGALRAVIRTAGEGTFAERGEYTVSGHLAACCIAREALALGHAEGCACAECRGKVM